MKTALIDADIFIYQVAYAAEKPVRWPDGVWTYHADEQEAFNGIESRVHATLSFLGTDKFYMALSSPTNFRKDIYPPYKSNRDGNRRPMMLSAVRKYVSANMPTVMYDGLEADDVLGIMATDDSFTGQKVIVSIDKDLLQIPVDVYNIDKDEMNYAEYRDGEYLHMHQTLTGDRVDGYPGCPGVGEKTADKILKGVDPKDRWEHVVKAYEKKGLDEEDALVQARLAKILQKEYFDKDGNVVLWEAK